MDYIHARPWLDNTMPRALKNLDITLGLALIPVQLFTATSSQGVAFHLLHAKCGSRIQMRLECPIHGIVPREETVRGYEINKDEYVRFEPEELKALEQVSSSALVIDTFVPEGAIDPRRRTILPRVRRDVYGRLRRQWRPGEGWEQVLRQLRGSSRGHSAIEVQQARRIEKLGRNMLASVSSGDDAATWLFVA
jgi:hypothetical protein